MGNAPMASKQHQQEHGRSPRKRPLIECSSTPSLMELKNGVLSDKDCHKTGTTHRRSAIPDRPYQLRTKIDAWNETNRIGTPVEYGRNNCSMMRTATSTGAEVLGDHAVFVWLEGVTGSFDLEWRDALCSLARSASSEPLEPSIERSPGPASRRGLHLPLRRALDEALKDQP
jgi:hypothetical protein